VPHDQLGRLHSSRARAHQTAELLSSLDGGDSGPGWHQRREGRGRCRLAFGCPGGSGSQAREGDRANKRPHACSCASASTH